MKNKHEAEQQLRNEKIKALRLPGLLQNRERYLKEAAAKRLSASSLLDIIIDEEYCLQQERSCNYRMRRAAIPEEYEIETYPFSRQPKLNKKMVMALYDSLDFMQQKNNIIWIGPTGCGKTGLATSFLTHVIRQGYSGRYVLFADLISELFRSCADHSEDRILKKYLNCDCLLIDEIGYLEIEAHQVGLFFTLMQKRHKRKPTLLTSNMGFSEWSAFLKNDNLTAALIDRLTENSHLMAMQDCVSLRPKLKTVT